MDYFIKQAAARARKPSAAMPPPSGTVRFRTAVVRFDFTGFYYNNARLFAKTRNSLTEVDKSLAVMNTFAYQAHVLTELARMLAKHGHLRDLYFAPVGWLAGAPGTELPLTHAAARIIRRCSQPDLEDAVRGLLARYEVENLSVTSAEESGILRFDSKDLRDADYRPVCVMFFYPFDPEKVLAVVFVGRHEDSHCGISYLLNRTHAGTFLRSIFRFVRHIYTVSDELGTFATARISNHAARLQKLPVSAFTNLCEVTHNFDPALFGEPTDLDHPGFVPRVPKIPVSILDLPDGVPITCSATNGLEVVTHIAGQRLRSVLVIVKDRFLKDTPLDGVFSKENLLRNRRYTFTVTAANFKCPSLGADAASASGAPLTARRSGGSGTWAPGYVTRTPAHVL
ncbi:telomere-binding protein [Western grey kangaroopox virus]|uniref:Telomere-binding protein n=1 Tax=Western grey kangaroopox virus TaxID=1566307 RepID=A0A2C9DSK8_9POXV|nr:telomere-binding protein [Western grey kangaroopox virus]ATI20991.1 telomere-binding protein [Western grey kangaroopox virus]